MFDETSERASRMMYAIETEPSTIAGISRSRNPGFEPAVTGRMRHLTPRRYCPRKPVTKVGTEISSSETIRMTESYHLPFFRPEMTPNTQPKIASKQNAINASLIVTGNARPISAMTGCPAKVSPKLRLSAFFRNSRYCTMNGLSRLYSARIWAATASLTGLSPNIALTGSPGSAKTSAYTNSVVPRTTGIICRMRRRRYLPIGCSLLSYRPHQGMTRHAARGRGIQ